jgi:hypothetical protein
MKNRRLTETFLTVVALEQDKFGAEKSIPGVSSLN